MALLEDFLLFSVGGEATAQKKKTKQQTMAPGEGLPSSGCYAIDLFFARELFLSLLFLKNISFIMTGDGQVRRFSF